MKTLFFAVMAILAQLGAIAPAVAAESVQTGIVLAVEQSTDPQASQYRPEGAMALGATIGGTMGYALSRRSGNAYLGTTLGAAAGAALGRRIESNSRGRLTYSIVVRLNDGNTVAITNPHPTVRPGQWVYLIGGNRVIPAGSAQ